MLLIRIARCEDIYASYRLGTCLIGTLVRYFEGGVSSVFLWDLDEGFAGVVLLKKCMSFLALFLTVSSISRHDTYDMTMID